MYVKHCNSLADNTDERDHNVLFLCMHYSDIKYTLFYISPSWENSQLSVMPLLLYVQNDKTSGGIMKCWLFSPAIFT